MNSARELQKQAEEWQQQLAGSGRVHHHPVLKFDLAGPKDMSAGSGLAAGSAVSRLLAVQPRIEIHTRSIP